MAEDPKEHTDKDYIEIKIPNQEAPAPERQEERPKEEKKPEKQAGKPKKKARKKKAAKPVTPKKQPKERNNNWIWATLLIIGLLVIAAVIYLSLKDITATDGEEDTRIAALVNNEPIYAAEVDDIYDRLSPTVKTETDKESILDQLIEQRLLLQEAKKQGIKATEDEIDAYIAELIAYFGIDEEQLDSLLAAENVTRESFEEDSKNQILVSKLINQTVYPTINITDEEIAARYEENLDAYAIPETATVRHILLEPRENETDEELQERAEDVHGLIEGNFSNFCDLVEEYTNDTVSIATCGEYVVAQDGRFVEEFEEAAFDMDVNETTITQSRFGQHIMLKVAHDEAGVLPLEEVSNLIASQLFQEEASAAVTAYLKALRDEAVIERYPEKTPVEEATAPLNPDEEEDLEVEVEKTKPIRTGDFGKCLDEAGATMYGVDWAPDVEEQIAILGEAFKEIDYVDCDADQPPAACRDITVWPTWTIGDGTTLKGKQSLNALSRETGCTI
ncbi:SurA N-terminal domain-containing protein [Candidatus Woesearchaeota archaeon]|nr:SurA N-terminal domain-containing protein [Candidatus Woesearchaeota archaeon]